MPNILPVRAKPSLDFVSDQEDTVAVADLSQRLQKLVGSRSEAAFPLHRLDDHRRDVGRIDVGSEQLIQCPEAVRDRDFVSLARERQMVDAGRRDSELHLVGQDLAGQCHRHRRAPVEPAGKCYQAHAAGGDAGDLGSVLDSLRTGREQDRFGAASEGGKGI